MPYKDIKRRYKVTIDWWKRHPDIWKKYDSTRDKLKVKARQKLNHAIKKGIIKRLEKCEKCISEFRVYAHHPDYSKPLEIIWLCQICHKKEDKLTT